MRIFWLTLVSTFTLMCILVVSICLTRPLVTSDDSVKIVAVNKVEGIPGRDIANAVVDFNKLVENKISIMTVNGMHLRLYPMPNRGAMTDCLAIQWNPIQDSLPAECLKGLRGNITIVSDE